MQDLCEAMPGLCQSRQGEGSSVGRHLYYSRTPVPPGPHTNRDIPSITSQPHYEDIRREGQRHSSLEDEALEKVGLLAHGVAVWAEVLALLRPT